jgi:hypothetical protein
MTDGAYSMCETCPKNNGTLADENQRLHDEAVTAIAERDAAILLLEAEKKKMPVRFGRSFYAIITAIALLVAGHFNPLVTLDFFGSTLESTNLLQVCGVILLIVTFIGPFLISAIAAFKGTHQKPQ